MTGRHRVVREVLTHRSLTVNRSWSGFYHIGHWTHCLMNKESIQIHFLRPVSKEVRRRDRQQAYWSKGIETLILLLTLLTLHRLHTIWPTLPFTTPYDGSSTPPPPTTYLCIRPAQTPSNSPFIIPQIPTSTPRHILCDLRFCRSSSAERVKRISI